MPRRWRRRSPTTSPPSMAPCATATIGNTGRSSSSTGWVPRYLAERLAQEKLPVPPLIAKAAEAGGFYREREAHARAARLRRRLSSDRAPAGRAAAGRHQARRQAAGRQWLGQPLGYRRRRRLPRIPQQDEQHRSRQLPAAAPIPRSGRQAQAEGAGDLQRGREFLRRRSISASPSSRPISRCGR